MVLRGYWQLPLLWPSGSQGKAPVRRSRKDPLDVWELMEPTLDQLGQEMREAERELHEGKRRGGDKNLIAQWKKQGCGNLCCIQTQDTNSGTSCRVPRSKLEVGRIIECTH
uniref:Uncharacterized protein n=1 Tax=Geospiza parvula TaxID=87175 RepID=A0A8C3NGT6_GEOPR